MSFSKADISLVNQCYVINGNNSDNKGQQSNGSGKTSLVDIVAICLLGQSLTDRDLKLCVNRYGSENYFITTLTLSQGVRISRKIYNNTKGQELSISIDNKPIVDLPTKSGVDNGVDVKLGNRWILESLLKISKEDLLNYYIISPPPTGTYKGFLASNNQDKIAVISRFSKADIIDKAIERLKKIEKETSVSIVEKESKIHNIDGQITGLQNAISQQAIDQWENSKQQRIQTATDQIERLNQQLDSKQEQLDKLQTLLQQTFDKQKLLQIRDQINELKQLKQNIDVTIRQIDTKLVTQITCPKCSHQFVVNSDKPVDQLKLERSESEQDLQVIKQELNEQISQEEQQVQAQRSQTEITNLSLSIENLICLTEQQLCQLESVENEQFEVINTNDQQNKLLQQHIVFQNEILELQKQKSNCVTWIDNFERFKYYLINKPVSVIQSLTNDILKKIGSEYSIEIEGFKKLKSGELRAELTPTVYINGINPCSYNSFSAGERTRLNLACDLAIQQMINSCSEGGLNYYQSDEGVSALDSVGMESVAKAFSCLNKTVMLISHSGSDINYPNVITIQKKNKQSVVI